jgi:hypothetical protein
MGADLYIQPVFTENWEQWEPLFNQAVERRDKAAEGSLERKKVEEEVEHYFDQMYARGYFRDPYNDLDLLWHFRLSWWGDIIPLLDSEGCLSVEQTRKFASMLKEREANLEESLAALSESDQRYFRARYRELKKFLKEAIEQNLPIECSL